MIVTELKLSEAAARVRAAGLPFGTPTDVVNGASEVWPGSKPMYDGERDVVILRGFH